MAAIEKVCEFSGDYPGWDMYRYKHNHIQICPKYRKLFRHQTATLYIQTDEQLLGQFLIGYRTGLYSHYTTEQYINDIITINGKKYKVDDRYTQWHPVKISKEFLYALVVPELPGNVDGIYINTSCNLSAVKRKMKRMLRCKKLDIRFIDNINNIKKELYE